MSAVLEVVEVALAVAHALERIGSTSPFDSPR